MVGALFPAGQAKALAKEAPMAKNEEKYTKFLLTEEDIHAAIASMYYVVKYPTNDNSCSAGHDAISHQQVIAPRIIG